MNIPKIIYGLAGVFLSCAGLSVLSLVVFVYAVHRFSNSFTAEQWGFLFWVAIAWPFAIAICVMAFVAIKQRNQITESET
jgi:hypothetical protein